MITQPLVPTAGFDAPVSRSSPDWTRAGVPGTLTQSYLLEEAWTSRLLAFGVCLIAGIITLFLAWASIAHVDEMAVANGQVVPSGYVQSVQHPDGGIVRRIAIQDGQFVKKGQTLMVMDATNANADLGQMLARQSSLRHQALRLKSYVSNQEVKNQAGDNNLTGQEKAILDSMEQSRQLQQDVLLDQIAQKQKELSALSASRNALEKNVSLLSQQTKMYDDMVRSGSGSQMMVMNSERDMNQLRGQLEETISSQRRAQDAIREAQNRLLSVGADLKQDAMKSLGQVEADLRELDKAIEKAKGVADRTTVSAPVNGIVKGLAVHTIGAVIQPGQVLMEVVPVDREMIVETSVSPSDIGHIRAGQAVKLKISAYDFARYGNVPGVVDNVSATTFQTDKDETFYKVKVRLQKNYVGADPEKNRIMPGMTVQANIVTGEKTVMQYLLKPIQYTLDTALHES